MNRNALFALLAAALFGISTPLAKQLLVSLSPVLLAGLLYLGSGVGLAMVRFVRDRGWQAPGLLKVEWFWLMGAIFFGGVAAPVVCMYGLIWTPGSTASLLLNLEAVLTALIAWVVFKENADRRMVLGMAAIVAGGVVLSWPTDTHRHAGWMGPVFMGLACLGWAIDNNLTRKVSASDAVFIAASKGLVAGLVNTVLAFSLGAHLPSVWVGLGAMAMGLFGYGLSLVLFVLALRGLGTARTGAYFSVAPFIGASVAVMAFGESTGLLFWVAATLMAWGLWLHLSETHAHAHWHTPMTHDHPHSHDEHHQHAHDFFWSGSGTHQHRHTHALVRHMHPHFPDIHHRHEH